MEEELHIQPGEVWICKRTVRMSGSGDVVYIEGKTYRSECLDCLTDECGEIHHYWTEYPSEESYKLFPQYFRRVPRNKRSRWRKENKRES